MRALDLPPHTSRAKQEKPDTSSGTILDVLAAVARKDYKDHRYQGRPEDAGRNAGIMSMLKAEAKKSKVGPGISSVRSLV